MKKILLASLLISSLANAGVPASFTYQGVVMNSAGTAPLTSVISLTLSLYDPTGTCLLYQEQQANIDLSQTNGTFAVQVGSVPGTSKRTLLDQALPMTSVFANNGQILAASTTNCSAGYTPGTTDNRLLRVSVTNGGSTVTISPDLQINAVPNAMVAETLQGYTPTNIYTPVGSLVAMATTSCPAGYVVTNGQSLVRSSFPALFTAIGTTYGFQTSTTFNVPDTRGYFLRGLDTTGTVDVNGSTRTVGSTEQDSMQGHVHQINGDVGGAGSISVGFTDSTSARGPGTTTGPISDGTNGTPRVTAETRPKNFAVNYCIKF
jgi:microcystin-dependent protein